LHLNVQNKNFLFLFKLITKRINYKNSNKVKSNKVIKYNLRLYCNIYINISNNKYKIKSHIDCFRYLL